MWVLRPKMVGASKEGSGFSHHRDRKMNNDGKPRQP